MDTKSFLIYLLVMSGVTYLVRMLPFVLCKKKITNTFLKSFFTYVPYAVLSAMTIPSVFYSTSNINTAIVGFIVGASLGLMEKNLVTVAIATCISVYFAGLLI